MGKLDPAISKSGKVQDSTLEPWVQRLYELNIYGRWITIGSLWLLIGLPSLWRLRHEIELLQEYFTWPALKYGLIYNQWPSTGLFLCLSMTTAVLVWLGRNKIWGLPKSERQRLERQAFRIRKQGSSHPLWRWVSGSQTSKPDDPHEKPDNHHH